MASSSTQLLSISISISLVAFLFFITVSADPDMLQDLCVADLSSGNKNLDLTLLISSSLKKALTFIEFFRNQSQSVFHLT